MCIISWPHPLNGAAGGRAEARPILPGSVHRAQSCVGSSAGTQRGTSTRVRETRSHPHTSHHLLLRPHRWAVVHRDRLLAHGSCLEFKLRQLKFLSLLSCGQSTEALAYAKILGQFSPKHNNGRSLPLCLNSNLYTHIYCVTSFGMVLLCRDQETHGMFPVRSLWPRAQSVL